MSHRPSRLQVARTPSPDVRYGHPCPALTRCRLRSGILPALVSNAGSRAAGHL